MGREPGPPPGQFREHTSKHRLRQLQAEKATRGYFSSGLCLIHAHRYEEVLVKAVIAVGGLEAQTTNTREAKTEVVSRSPWTLDCSS